MKIDWREFFPERDCLRNGDPFVARIVEFDDLIVDYSFNAGWLGVEAATARATVQSLDAERAEYEVDTLSRWIRL